MLARADEPGGRYAVWALLARWRALPDFASLAKAIAARIGAAAVDVYFVRDDLDDRARAAQVLLDEDDAAPLDSVNDLLPAYVFDDGEPTLAATHALAERFRARVPVALVKVIDRVVSAELMRVEQWDSEFTPPPSAPIEILERLLAMPLPGLDRTWFARAVAFHAPSLAAWLGAAGALPVEEAWESRLVSGDGSLRVDGNEVEAAAGVIELSDAVWVYGKKVARFPPSAPASSLRTLVFEHCDGPLPLLSTAELPALESLRFLQCGRCELPEWVGGLETLTALEYSTYFGGELRVTPALGRLGRLEELKLYGSRLILPESMANLSSLRRLTIDVFGLPVYPKCLCALPALEELDVSSHVQKTLPDELVGLRALRRLRLSPLEAEAPPPVLARMPWLERLAIWSAVNYRAADIEALARALPSTKLEITYTANAR